MVWIPGGLFQMGSDRHYPEEAPAHPARIDGFWMDRFPVTNGLFRKFVEATGYLTVAELPADPADYPGVPSDRLVPASAVFVPPAGPVPLTDPYRWWHSIPGADWRHPEGPGSSIKGREDHPVVHVTHADANAYAAWSGKSLPSEAEWERAARGGVDRAEFAWGDELHPGGVPLANTFQGTFPHHNSGWDGFERTSPVGSFPANCFGVFDLIGNVWEWTDDWFVSPIQRFQAVHASGCCHPSTLPDASKQASVQTSGQSEGIPRRVIKGGSFLCSPSYCRRYRPAARLAQPIDTSTCHVGFRCILRPFPTHS
jgi:formylglycine-generating enzyme required for sulfatase activity